MKVYKVEDCLGCPHADGSAEYLRCRKLDHGITKKLNQISDDCPLEDYFEVSVDPAKAGEDYIVNTTTNPSHTWITPADSIKGNIHYVGDDGEEINVSHLKSENDKLKAESIDLGIEVKRLRDVIYIYENLVKHLLKERES